MTLNLDHSHAHNSIPMACRGCRHYFGQTHGGHHLNCAHHPYGPGADRCPDHKQLTADSPRTSTTLPYQGTATRDPWEVLNGVEDANARQAMVRRMVNALWRVVQELAR